mmetsp:Transcript_25021/g.59053  ORF Transcript_25021/g.59053 Transcript_25021/m.59053 type:complete len:1066 (-) Transcript_25021:465-3662(-)
MTRSVPRCELLHHGAAANSSPKVIACIQNVRGTSVQGEGEMKDASSEIGTETTELVYASHLMLNVAKPKKLLLNPVDDSGDSNGVSNHEKIWNVERTLRTRTSLTQEEAETAAANVSTRTAKRVITSVVQLKWLSSQDTENASKYDVVLVCGFSDGSLTCWYRPHRHREWEEHVLLSFGENCVSELSSAEQNLEERAVLAMKGRSITDIDGYAVSGREQSEQQRLDLSVVTCSSGGAQYFQFCLKLKSSDDVQPYSKYATINDTKRLIGTPSNAVKFHTIVSDGEGSNIGDGYRKNLGIFLVGTAAPRHNKIHVLVVSPTCRSDASTTTMNNDILVAPKYSGSLTGHEDWITCFDWTKSVISVNTADDGVGATSSSSDCVYLASGSQDAKIRLWKWITKSSELEENTVPPEDFSNELEVAEEEASGIALSGDNGGDDDDEEEVIEGEARLDIQHYSSTKSHQLKTSVYLEALLIGHEEMVTSVAWHPNPKEIYGQDMILVSSSMDRSIFLWSSTDGDERNNSTGVWTPISRVGSPSGILGGPVGSSLLGYLRVEIEPQFGRWIMGHAYGGAMHFFSCEGNVQTEKLNVESCEESHLSIEERAAIVKWKAQPCITGHFDEVTDLCWEALEGDYLITVSNDATCRLWAPVTNSLDLWIEISRPQVHGYTLSAVTSLSTEDHKHHLVTGADEKELRAFDGTNSFLRMLRLASEARGEKIASIENNDISRVERAYMPSLGLSNKDTAADGADEDTAATSTSSTMLPIEKDLGSTSLWPETRKLYGHNAEIARLASTLSARTCQSLRYSTPYFDQILVASSTKARDINTANIRLWDVDMNRCLQTLQGGHRSTVTALNFSPDGTYLASSGKDRRLCIWKRYDINNSSEESELFFLASAVHSSHKRIVWSVHFCPYIPTILASGSRDGTVKLWKITDRSEEVEQNITLVEYSKFIPTVDMGNSGGSKPKPQAVTSLAFSPSKLFNVDRGVLAIGLENGFIQLWSVPLISSLEDTSVEKPTTVAFFDPQICHIGAIKKLAWRPATDKSEGPLVLASCSSDNGCRIFSVWLRK